MSIDIKRGSDVRMSHEILKRFRIHPGLRHVGTVGMAAYMRCNLGHLKLVNGIILVHYMLKVMVICIPDFLNFTLKTCTSLSPFLLLEQ